MTQVGLVSGGADGMIKIWADGAGVSQRALDGGVSRRFAKGSGGTGSVNSGRAPVGAPSDSLIVRKYDIKMLAADGMQVRFICHSPPSYIGECFVCLHKMGMPMSC